MRVFLKRTVTGLGLRVSDPLPAAQILDSGIDTVARQTSRLQNASRRRVPLGENSEENVLGGDVFILETVGFLIRKVNNAFHTRGDKNLSCTTTKDIGFRAGA